MYIAFHLHFLREFKKLGKEQELTNIYSLSEKVSKDLIIKIRDSSYAKIVEKIDLDKNISLYKLGRTEFMKLFFKRFDKHSNLITGSNDIIRVYIPIEDGGVYTSESSYVDVAIKRTDLPIGFLRIGFDYFLVNNNEHLHYQIGLRSKKRMKEWLGFDNDIDFKKIEEDGWDLAIIP
ncbi:hypothetical protein [Fluviispira sanaruensis]|uniref:hypothetical protein n=1 Tax=Fluviispira sanaruensis TaxID=2493639 RepID=UPI00102E9D79|nr:hypothetical protein [Fluviispira sanaruensis]